MVINKEPLGAERSSQMSELLQPVSAKQSYVTELQMVKTLVLSSPIVLAAQRMSIKVS